MSDLARSDEYERTGGELDAHVHFRRLPSRRVLPLCRKVAAEIDGGSPVLESWLSEEMFFEVNRWPQYAPYTRRKRGSAKRKAYVVTLTDSDDV